MLLRVDHANEELIVNLRMYYFEPGINVPFFPKTFELFYITSNLKVNVNLIYKFAST